MIKYIVSVVTALVFATLCFQAKAQSQANKKHLIVMGKSDDVFSKILGEKRKVWVHVPRQASKLKKLPVLYLLDGKQHLKAVSAMFELDDDFLPPMIIVAIGTYNQHRTRDLTPTADPKRPGSGGGEKFTDFIEKELIPHIERKYPVTSHRTFVGHSLGGLLVVNTLVKRPHLFTNYIAIDPSLYWKNESFLQEALATLKKDKLTKKALFVAVANTIRVERPDLDIATAMNDKSMATRHLRGVFKFSQQVEAAQCKGLQFTWKYYGDESHNSVTFKSIYDGLRKVFAWHTPDPAMVRQFIDPATSVQKAVNLLDAHFARLTTNFGYEFVPSEDFLNNVGYLFLNKKQFKHSEVFFKRNIKFYPESANVYDSLGDCYVAQADYANALKCFTKAYKISGNKYHKSKIKRLKAGMKGRK